MKTTSSSGLYEAMSSRLKLLGEDLQKLEETQPRTLEIRKQLHDHYLVMADAYEEDGWEATAKTFRSTARRIYTDLTTLQKLDEKRRRLIDQYTIGEKYGTPDRAEALRTVYIDMAIVASNAGLKGLAHYLYDISDSNFVEMWRHTERVRFAQKLRQRDRVENAIRELLERNGYL